MALGYNSITITGRVSRDPNMRYTPNNIPVCDFSVAVNKRTKAMDGGVKETTKYFKVTVWRQQAEFVNQYLAKGREVLVEGEAGGSVYLDKEGKPALSLEIDAHVVQLLGSKPAEEENLADIPF